MSGSRFGQAFCSAQEALERMEGLKDEGWRDGVHSVETLQYSMYIYVVCNM